MSTTGTSPPPTTELYAGFKRRISERGVRYDVSFIRHDNDSSDDQAFQPDELLELALLAEYAYDVVLAEYARDCDALRLG